MKKVVVVGAGNWGQNLIKNFYALEALSGVAEVDPELRSKVAANYADLVTYLDFAEVLASDIPAVVLATPAPSHYKLAMTALEAGKDVFVEKPMTLHAEEARKLAAYADRHDRILMVGHLLLYQPAIAWMRDYIASGQLGEVKRAIAQRTKLGKVRSTENVWWSFAPHDVSVVLELLGRPELQSVVATGTAILQPEIADDVHVDLTFTCGKTAHIHASWYSPINRRQTIVIGDRQMLVYDEVAQTVTIHDKSVDANLNHLDRGERIVEVAATAPLQLECQHFLDCLTTRDRPKSDGWNGVAVVDVLERAQTALAAKHINVLGNLV
jgi:predicted dehydrogenase